MARITINSSYVLICIPPCQDSGRKAAAALPTAQVSILYCHGAVVVSAFYRPLGGDRSDPPPILSGDHNDLIAVDIMIFLIRTQAQGDGRMGAPAAGSLNCVISHTLNGRRNQLIFEYVHPPKVSYQSWAQNCAEWATVENSTAALFVIR